MFKQLCLAICLEWHYANWNKSARSMNKQQYRDLFGGGLAWACGAWDFWLDEAP